MRTRIDLKKTEQKNILIKEENEYSKGKERKEKQTLKELNEK